MTLFSDIVRWLTAPALVEPILQRPQRARTRIVSGRSLLRGHWIEKATTGRRERVSVGRGDAAASGHAPERGWWVRERMRQVQATAQSAPVKLLQNRKSLDHEATAALLVRRRVRKGLGSGALRTQKRQQRSEKRQRSSGGARAVLPRSPDLYLRLEVVRVGHGHEAGENGLLL